MAAARRHQAVEAAWTAALSMADAPPVQHDSMAATAPALNTTRLSLPLGYVCWASSPPPTPSSRQAAGIKLDIRLLERPHAGSAAACVWRAWCAGIVTQDTKAYVTGGIGARAS
mgnify:CR=1 FL=1